MPAPKPEPAPKLAPAPKPVPTSTKVGLWAAIVSAAGSVAHWLGDHILLTIGAAIVTAIAASFLVSHLKNGD
jgi:hypothetical protein